MSVSTITTGTVQLEEFTTRNGQDAVSVKIKNNDGCATVTSIGALFGNQIERFGGLENGATGRIETIEKKNGYNQILTFTPDDSIPAFEPDTLPAYLVATENTAKDGRPYANLAITEDDNMPWEDYGCVFEPDLLNRVMAMRAKAKVVIDYAIDAKTNYPVVLDVQEIG